MFLYSPFPFKVKSFLLFCLLKISKRPNLQSHCCNLKLATAASFDEKQNLVATKIELSFWAFNNIIGSFYNMKNILSFFNRCAFRAMNIFHIKNSFMSTLYSIILPNIENSLLCEKYNFNDFLPYKYEMIFGTSVTVAHFFYIKNYFSLHLTWQVKLIFWQIQTTFVSRCFIQVSTSPIKYQGSINEY